MLESFKVSKQITEKVVSLRCCSYKDDLFASEIAKGIDILQAITCAADAWKEVSVETVKSCLAKSGITEHGGSTSLSYLHVLKKHVKMEMT